MFTLRGVVSSASTATAVCCLLGAAPASAAVQDDLWNELNAAHVAAGCAPYGHDDALSAVAVQYAQTMAEHNGQKNFSPTPTFTPTTENLLNNRGYFPTAFGDMEYYNPETGVPIDTGLHPEVFPPLPTPADPKVTLAVQFWQKNQTNGLITNCQIQQMDDAVWIIGHNWAAAAVLGTPGPAPGPLPQQDQPH